MLRGESLPSESARRAAGRGGGVMAQHRPEAAVRLELVHERLDRADVARRPLEEQAVAAEGLLDRPARGTRVVGVM